MNNLQNLSINIISTTLCALLFIVCSMLQMLCYSVSPSSSAAAATAVKHLECCMLHLQVERLPRDAMVELHATGHSALHMGQYRSPKKLNMSFSRTCTLNVVGLVFIYLLVFSLILNFLLSTVDLTLSFFIFLNTCNKAICSELPNSSFLHIY